jgi:hypothetical protein
MVITQKRIDEWCKEMGFKEASDGYVAMYSSSIIKDENRNVDVKIYPNSDSGLNEEDVKRIRDSYLNNMVK